MTNDGMTNDEGGKAFRHSNIRHSSFSAKVACVPLPGARESFDWDQRTYQTGELRRVPLLACEGRYASVVASAKHPASATQLLRGLASGDWGVRVSSASSATAVFRNSQVEEAARWTSAGGALAAAYAEAVAASLGAQEVTYALRIPGRDEYLGALDQAVRAAVRGQRKPQEALAAAASQWQTITQKYGVDAQCKACERSDVRIEH
jgi:multiple sugar transport system substrate-binding protein